MHFLPSSKPAQDLRANSADFVLFAMLWVDKYRPTALDKMSFHVPLSERLSRLVRQASRLPAFDAH